MKINPVFCSFLSRFLFLSGFAVMGWLTLFAFSTSQQTFFALFIFCAAAGLLARSRTHTTETCGPVPVAVIDILLVLVVTAVVASVSITSTGIVLGISDVILSIIVVAVLLAAAANYMFCLWTQKNDAA